ncbi:MAG: chromosome partitioning protein ParB [Thiothrix sp.]|nr:MAG: chromosome partitioning protein ParB [Thiothrix sp.]
MSNKLGLSAGRPSENRKKQALAAINDEGRTVRVNFDVSEEEHLRLKLFAVKSRRTVAEIMRELIDKNIPKLSE